jgi:membrane-associated phospholipid phosphatase
MPIGLPQAVDTFDGLVDQQWERFRANPVMQRVALTASEVGDFGVVWMLLAAVPALGGSPRHGRALIRMGAALAFESLIVNQGLKRLFKRSRPDRDALESTVVANRHAIRHPSTSSFPSGHCTSAVTAAVLLSETSPIPAPVLWAAAGVVASSRVHVRMHHASDVIGGVGVGLAVGTLIRRFVRI